jgi:hypothetical protein
VFGGCGLRGFGGFGRFRGRCLSAHDCAGGGQGTGDEKTAAGKRGSRRFVRAGEERASHESGIARKFGGRRAGCGRVEAVKGARWGKLNAQFASSGKVVGIGRGCRSRCCRRHRR